MSTRSSLCAGSAAIDRSSNGVSVRQLSLISVSRNEPREAVAARLGDDVDDAAAEAAVFGGDAGGGHRRFLDRVLDVEVVGLAAQVLVHGDAVDQEQVVERHRAGDRVGAVRPAGMHRRREQQVGVDVAVGRQGGDQVLLEVGGDLRRLRQHVGALADDGHVPRSPWRAQVPL